MRCYICNCDFSDLKIDRRDNSIRPCQQCEAVISETLKSYELEADEGETFERYEYDEYLLSKTNLVD